MNDRVLEKHGGEISATQASAAELRLWLRLLTCSTLVEKRLRTMLAAEFGSTLPRFDVLAALDRAEQGLTMGALSRALLVSNGNVTALVQTLVREGLVETLPSETDRRASIVRLTPAGQTAFIAQAGRHHALIGRLFKGLSARERTELHALLGRLKASLGASGEFQ
ncbi:MAG: MarR family winged helix-turn-helix transcriptional regulator [Thermaurantiacus sp.]